MLLIENKVEVAPPCVEEPMEKRVPPYAEPAPAKSERRPVGEVVPIPTLPALVTMKVVEEVEPMTNIGAVPIAFVGFMET
jgi:hypothetical protein